MIVWPVTVTYIILHTISYYTSLSKFKIKKIKMKSKNKINKNQSTCSQFFTEDSFWLFQSTVTSEDKKSPGNLVLIIGKLVYK